MVRSTSPTEGAPSITSSTEGWALLFGALLAIFGYIAWSRSRSMPSAPPAATAAPAAAPVDEGARDPGTLEFSLIELPQPAYNQNDELCRIARSEWTFPGASDGDVRARLTAAGFEGATLDALLARLVCDGTGCTLDAPDPLLLSLPAGPRGRLYRGMAAFRGQTYAAIPFRRPTEFPPWERVARSPRVRDLFTRLSWREGVTTYLADVATGCRALEDQAERVEFLTLLRRRYSLDVRVHVRDTADPAAVARYWTLGDAPPSPAQLARTRDAQRDGRPIPLRELLTGWPATLLERFPSETSAERDCFWSTLHFADPEAERFSAPTPAGFAAELAARWREVPRASARYGDAIVLFGDAEPEHAMIHLAGDLVFTKNGRSRSRAWIVARLDEVLADYPRVRAVRAYRLAR